jgi:hypothetical protein
LQPRPPPPPAAEPVSLRVRFGVKDKEGQDWSGKMELSEGSVQSTRGWRWMPGDHANGNEWTIATRRGAAQSAAERKRVAEGAKLPVRDNGLIATLTDTKPDTSISFSSKPGDTTFKLSDIPYGKPHVALDGNLVIERVPSATDLAVSTDDEDYPTIARGKDGTLYLAYVAFTHGKDFQGPRERPASAESGPVVGPLAAGAVRKIEKPEDLDYLAQPTGGEQIYLRIRRPDGAWQEPIAVTDKKNELYRPAIAVDGSGHVWVFYSAHLDADKNLDHGNWELMARRFDAQGKPGGDAINLSNEAGSDFMPAATTDSAGKAWVTWVGGRGAISTSSSPDSRATTSSPSRKRSAPTNPTPGSPPSPPVPTASSPSRGTRTRKGTTTSTSRCATAKGRRSATRSRSRRRCRLKSAHPCSSTKTIASGSPGKKAATSGARISAR